MVKNTNKCPVKIWKKFSGAEKERYNNLRELLKWEFIYPPDIQNHKNKDEIIDVVAHNIVCEIIWGKL